MSYALNELYNVILNRKNESVDGSYTCYLFEQGLNKILKKCGEECSEVIIAAKDGNPDEIKAEIADLLYHLIVLMAEKGIGLEEIDEILADRAMKIGNLKTSHKSDIES
ncbi:phosphoribosyl-ATP diphosphatase [Bacillota bacterium]